MKPDLILRDLPLPITTPRLVIKPPVPGMGQQFYEAKAESQGHLKEWMGWAHKESSIEIEETTMRKQAAKFMAREDLMLIVFDHAGRLIGSSGFHYVNDLATPVVHIGYWIRDSERGKGYVTEWVNALTRYGFEVLGFKKICIHCDNENEASIAVTQRLGYELEYTSKWGIAKPSSDAMRILNVYSRFDTDGLPDLDVHWD